MKRLYLRPSGVSRRALSLIAALSLAVLFAVERLPVLERQPYFSEKVAAESLRSRPRAVRAEKQAKGLRIDPEADPAGTGLIGVAYSKVTSNTGDLISKRTANNPNFAAVIVQFLHDVGVAGRQRRRRRLRLAPGVEHRRLPALQTVGAEPIVDLERPPASGARTIRSPSGSTWRSCSRTSRSSASVRSRLRGRHDDRGFWPSRRAVAARRGDSTELARAPPTRTRCPKPSICACRLTIASIATNRSRPTSTSAGAGVGRHVMWAKRQLKPGVNFTTPKGAPAVETWRRPLPPARSAGHPRDQDGHFGEALRAARRS